MSDPQQPTTQPLDLSAFASLATPDEAGNPASGSDSSRLPVDTAESTEIAAPMPAFERLVELSTLPAELQTRAHQLADSIRFEDTASTLTFIEHTLQPIAQVSRQLLADTTVGNAGEVGQIAAAVIDGIKILRIDELQAEAHKIAPKATGLLGRVMGLGKLAHDAVQSFAENRKKFLTLMDAEEARARKAKADLMTTVQLLDDQSQTVRQGVGNLTIAIAAAQIALDRGVQEAEELRQIALRSNTSGDAAIAMDRRNTLANFRAQTADMREAMVSAATLIPLIALNRKAAVTRVSQLNSGILLTLPRLMAVASQAAVEADVQRGGQEKEKLDEANRRITEIAGRAAHDAAISAARSLQGDNRNLEALSALAEQTISTMQEVLKIEQDAADEDRKREQELVRVRDRLVSGMRGVQQAALARPVRGA
ncbi:hypothetical protein GXB81_27540 [Paraburkholderia sp. Ac-20336]|uniref:toxic anion resistance protein n=1 Tax=Paraburkholderia sp. Ac-20336 TaxID=2703886 RepID=UPI001980FC83|nr:toxic anion resistance protein [Paraburkholderia sp. Ac-20336]MBN3806773.1 hypothetical protein [Paraburkholderia sp. Ac-20336]